MQLTAQSVMILLVTAHVDVDVDVCVANYTLSASRVAVQSPQMHCMRFCWLQALQAQRLQDTAQLNALTAENNRLKIRQT